MTRNSRRLQKAVQAIFNDYREKASCAGQVYQNAACGCDNALQMWRGPKGDKGDTGPQGPKGDNAGSFLVDAEFVVDPVGQEPGAYLKLVLIDVAQQEQVVYVDLSELTDIYLGGNGISIVDMVVAAKLGAGLTFDQSGNIASAYQFCDGLDEASNVVTVKLDANNHILGFAGSGCKGLTATVSLAASATGTNLVLTGADNAVLSTVPLVAGSGIIIRKTDNGFTWLADPAGLVSSQSGNQLSVSQSDSKLYVGGNTLNYTFGSGTFTLKDASDNTLSSVTVPSAVRMLEGVELMTDDGVYLHLTYLRDNGLRAYQDVSLDGLFCHDVETDDFSATAYATAVPSGNWNTASLSALGGRTVVWNQLVPTPTNMPYTSNGVTFTLQNDGSIKATGTVTEGASFASYSINSIPVTSNHVYLCCGCPQGGGASIYMLDTAFSIGRDYGNGTMGKFTGTITQGYVRIYIYPDAGEINLVWKPVLIDLTLMFGAGNEPATVAEFEAMFPTIDPAYNAGELRSAGVTEVVSQGRNLLNPDSLELHGSYQGYTVNPDAETVTLSISDKETSVSLDGIFFGLFNADYAPLGTVAWIVSNGIITAQSLTRDLPNFVIYPNTAAAKATVFNRFDIQIERGSTATAYTPYFSTSLPIPAAIRALPGYGWSAGTAKNWVDFVRKLYVQEVGSVDLGTLTWTYQEANTRFYAISPTTIKPSTNNNKPNYLCANYVTAAYNIFQGDLLNKAVTETTTGSLFIRDTAYTDAAAFKSAMSGVSLYFELAAPIETDISALLTGNSIEVEPGGTLTFANQHGDDFRLPVPVSGSYVYERPWVFEDCVREVVWKETTPALEELSERIDSLSVELELDAECKDVVTPGTREAFPGNAILYVEYPSGGTLAQFYTDGISDTVTASGIDSDGPFVFYLSICTATNCDGRNGYILAATTVTDFVAAGADGLVLPLDYFDSFSGIDRGTPIFLSCVSNGGGSYTFNIMTGTEATTETELIIDLVSGENRTDLKPVLEHIGGTVKTVEELGEPVQAQFGYIGAGFVIGQSRSDFATAYAFANSPEDICNGDNLVQPTSSGPGTTDFSFYFDTLPTHFIFHGFTECDTDGNVSNTLFYPPAIDFETGMCTGEGTAIADVVGEGVLYKEYDISSRPPQLTGRSLLVRASVGNAGIVFTIWLSSIVERQVLCLEPSCEPCIDMTPLLDAIPQPDLSAYALRTDLDDYAELADLNGYLPLSGGTMTGNLYFLGAGNRLFGFKLTNSNKNLDIGWDWDTKAGAGMAMRSVADSDAGAFHIWARNASGTTKILIGKPNGSLTWDNQEVITANKLATTSANGLMTSTDKAKLDGLSQYPRITRLYTAAAGSTTTVNNFPTDQNSTLSIASQYGLRLSQQAQSDAIQVNINVEPSDFAGTGLGTVTVSGNKKLVVPQYQGASSNDNGVAGTVPPASAGEEDLFLKGDGTWDTPSGGSSFTPGTGLVMDNGVLRLALLHRTSYASGQIAINIASQANTPYSYDDDEDVYEDNPSPYVIDLSQNANKFNFVNLNIGKTMMTQAQVDALKPDMKSVFAKVYWASGASSLVTYVIPSTAWFSTSVMFNFDIPARSSSYPSAEIFDTISRIELVMTTSTNTYHPYGYNIGTYFPAGTNIYVNGTYWA